MSAMTGPADVSARPIAEAGNFRRRHEGDWDYFPRLSSPTGYHVTLAQRQALERLEKFERGAGWVVGFLVVTIVQVVAGKGVLGGLWVAGLGVVAWGLAMIAHRLIRLWMLRDSARVPVPLSDDEIEAIEDAGESRGATAILVTVIAGGIGGAIVPLLKQAGVHGPVAWVSALLLCLALFFASTLLWFDLRRGAVAVYRKLRSGRRS